MKALNDRYETQEDVGRGEKLELCEGSETT